MVKVQVRMYNKSRGLLQSNNTYAIQFVTVLHFAHSVKGQHGMQASRHVPVMMHMHNDCVWSACLQIPETDSIWIFRLSVATTRKLVVGYQKAKCYYSLRATNPHETDRGK